MNTLFCTIAGIVLTVAGFSQPKTEHSIANMRQNVVFIGIPNPLVVVVEGYKCKDITATTDNGRLEILENGCRYSLYPDSARKTLITIVARKNPNIVLGRSEFRAKRLPAPDAMVGGMSGGKIKRNVLRAQIGIIAELIGFDFDIRYEIVEYTVTILSKEYYFTESCTDSRFSKKVKQAFDLVEANDVVLFSNIKCKSPDGRKQDLRPLEFLVID